MLKTILNLEGVREVGREAQQHIVGASGGNENEGVCPRFPELGPIPCNEFCPDGTSPLCM